MKIFKNGTMIIIFITVMIISVYVKLFPFGYKAEKIKDYTARLEEYNIDKDIPNTSIYSYRVDEKINSKEEFINFLKKYEGNENSDMYSLAFDLGSFKGKDKNVIWEDVYDAIEIDYIFYRKVYRLEYKTSYVECNGNKISITKDGYVLDYRSAGI